MGRNIYFQAAITFEPVLLHRLRYIDLRINGTLAMLRDFPELERELRPVALSFWKTYRRENTPEVLGSEREGTTKEYLSDEEGNERLIRLYKKNFERHHSGARLDTQLEEASVSKAKAAKTTRKSMVVALKDVLKERKQSESEGDKTPEEDSDEDQVGRGMGPRDSRLKKID